MKEETIRDPRVMHIKSILNIYDIDKYGFDAAIKYRGEDIVNKEKVHDINCDDNCYTAIVEGSKYYNVSITFDKEGYLKASCTCPYYKEDKGYCKHIYALLYKVKCSDNRKVVVKKLKKMLRKVKFNYAIYSYKMTSNRDLFTDETHNDYDAFVHRYYSLINRVTAHLDRFTDEDRLLLDIADLDDMLDFIHNSHKAVKKALSEYNSIKLAALIKGNTSEGDDKMFKDYEDEELEKEMDTYDLDEEERDEVRKGNFDPWNFEYPGDDELEDDDYYVDDDV